MVNNCCGNGGKFKVFFAKSIFFLQTEVSSSAPVRRQGQEREWTLDIDRANSLYFYLQLATLPRSKRIGKTGEKSGLGHLTLSGQAGKSMLTVGNLAESACRKDLRLSCMQCSYRHEELAKFCYLKF
jgi:hypothetical protein